MKKVAFCAAAAAICGSLLAVESANVVGYVSTANLVAGRYYLIGQNFQSVTGGSVDLQSFITSSDMQGGEEDQGPNLKLWAGTGYDDYYFLAEDMDGNENVWSGDGFFAAEDVLVQPGSGFWLKYTNNPSGVNLKFSK